MSTNPLPFAEPASRLRELASLCYRYRFALAIAAIVFVGIKLRVGQHRLDRSLFVDEMMLAMNIKVKDYRGLTGTLHCDQWAPAMFLWSTKWLTKRLGEGDMVFRIVPMICGIGALLMCPAFLKRWRAGQPTILVATAIMALAPTLIYYSSEFKPYATDLFWCMALWMAFAATGNDRVSIRDYAILAFVGGFAVWNSMPVVFVMAGLGVCFGGYHLWHRRWRELGCFTLVGLVWLASFAGVYFLQYRNFRATSFAWVIWEHAFPPMPNFHGGLLVWFYDTLLNISTMPIGLASTGAGAVALVLGTWSLWRSNRYCLAALLCPFGVLLIVAAFRAHPFGGRVVIFLVPALIFLMAEGVAALWHGANARPMAVALTCVLLFAPTTLALKHTVNREFYQNPCFPGHPIQQMRQTLAFVKSKWQDGDKIVVVNHNRGLFSYYAPRFQFTSADTIEREYSPDTPWRKIYVDLHDQLAGQKRVWMVFSYSWPIGGMNEQIPLEEVFNNLGRKVEDYHAGHQCDGRAFLFDLSQPPMAPPMNWILPASTPMQARNER